VADDRSVDVSKPTEQPAPHQTLDALIEEAFRTPRVGAPHERYIELDELLRDAVEDLVAVAKKTQAGCERYSRDWWRLRNVLLDTGYELAKPLGEGLAAALHVSALARQVQALRAALDGKP
jgi:hypothetical protein